MLNLINTLKLKMKEPHLMTQISKLAERYAKALFDLAREAEQIEAMQTQLSILSEALQGHNKLMRALTTSLYSKAEQDKLIDVILKLLYRDDLSSASCRLLNNFLKTLVKKGRLSCLVDIIRAFQQLHLAWCNTARVELSTASTPTLEQEKELTELLKHILNKDILLESKLDKSLLGGFIVKFGSYQIDTSISTKLSSLKMALKEGS